MAVTLKDVAKKAGVSATTVSLVLNQGSNSRIGEATRNKILQIVKELGYQPNKSTQSIPLTVPPTIGLVFTDITNPFFTELASIVEDVASRYGYNIILCNTHRSLKKEAEYLEVLWRRRVDGLLIAPVDDQETTVQEFLKRNIPVVFIDRCIETPKETNAVLLDNVQGAYLATEYLLQLGHRRIGLINVRMNVLTGKERLQGYQRALQEYGVPLQEELIRDGLFSVEGGQESTQQLLDLPNPATAILSTGGVMTVGALLEIKHRRIKLPHDLSLIGFDDVDWCRLLEPPLTVIAQPIYDIGTQAAQMVIQLIQGWGAHEAKKIRLQPQLIVRESCAPYLPEVESKK